MATNGYAAPIGVATAESAYECGWLVKGLRCREEFSTLHGLLRHLGDKHGVRGPANLRQTCQWHDGQDVCRDELKRGSFKRHVEIHLGLPKRRCEVCGRSYSRADSLNAHIKSRHHTQF
ncbi:hypothetical protein BU15DRAFT_78109 [Melanogaster broomeanus]|nr:hypothetical protein BU15DRAFT_78109 [Melanogaster broomeanus]